MAKAKKEKTAQPEAPRDSVAELISTATDAKGDGVDSAPDQTESAVDALDAARGEPEQQSTTTATEPATETTQTEKPRRGRPAGARNKDRATTAPGTDVAEVMPKTKKELQDYAGKLRAERDTARAQNEAKKTALDAEAVGRLAAALSAGGQMVGSFMASRRGEHWRLKPEESEALGAAWATCLAPYADAIGTSLPWVIAIGVTYNVFAGRVAVDRAAVAEAEARDPQGPAQPRTGEPASQFMGKESIPLRHS